MTLTAALLLTAGPAMAQAPQTAGPGPASPFRGSADFGGVFTTTDGDEARYQRYRDERDGVFSNLTVNRSARVSLRRQRVAHRVPRSDIQRHLLGPEGDVRISVGLAAAQLQLHHAHAVSTNGTTLTLDDNIQRAVQGPTNATNDGTLVGVPCAPGAPPAACSTPAQAAQAKATPSGYNPVANTFDLRHRRDTAVLGLTYAATTSVDIDAGFTRRSGTAPSPGARPSRSTMPSKSHFRSTSGPTTSSLGPRGRTPSRCSAFGWDGSWFNNAFESLVWDNPIRITDFNNGLAPPNGPYDPSGYSNGNGPAQGRMALAPDNNMNVVSATGLYKLPGRSTLNGTLQFTSQNQDEALIPWTINSLITGTPAVIAEFPHLAQLPRSTAEAEAQGVNALINLSTRPYRRMNFTVRYRYNKRDVQTPVFDATEYVRFDAVPEEIEEGFSPQFDNSRHLVRCERLLQPDGPGDAARWLWPRGGRASWPRVQRRR